MKYIKLVFGEVLFEQKERPTVVHLLYVLSILQEEQEAHIVVIENHLSALQHNITNQCSFCIHMGGGLRWVLTKTLNHDLSAKFPQVWCLHSFNVL